jgi:hypothetical protein
MEETPYEEGGVVKRSLWILILVTLALTGCSLLQPPPPKAFQVTVSPESGHPPFAVTITATDMGEGTYTFELPDETIKQSGNLLTATVDRDPWTATVRWSSGTGIRHLVTIEVDIDNDPPDITAPRLAPYPDWLLHPRERTLLDFNDYPGSMYGPRTGIMDPDGDAWHIVEIQVLCETKYMADSIFCPPYRPGIFHATFQGHLIDNACIVYPTYTGRIDEKTGLPFPPMVEEGYPYNFRTDNNLTPGEMPAQTATIIVTAEDEWGARARKSFEIQVAALAF